MISSPVDQVFRTIITQALLLPLILCLSASGAMAGSATWSADPVSSDWTDPSNWLPETVPNGPTDVASFGASDLTDVSLSDDVGYELDSMVFLPGASAYNISLAFIYAPPFTIDGAGMVNQSAVTQNIVLASPGFRELMFTNESSAGSAMTYDVQGSDSGSGADISFYNDSSAGSGTFSNHGGIYFFDEANAGSASFTNHPAPRTGGSAAACAFNNPGSATGGRATFINEGSTISGIYGGALLFGNGSLDRCTAINYGASVAGGFGGITEISNGTAADRATLITYGGTNGGDGGVIQFSGSASGDNAQVQVYGNGRIEIAYRGAHVVSIGSLSGDGLATLGRWQLDVGNDNRDSTFSGRIEDGGVQGGTGASLAKSGTGRFSLKGSNTYTGGTFVNAGDFRVIGTGGSPTGTGPVLVNEGRLSGKGIMAGAVTIGKGDGAGAVFNPGRRGTPALLGSKSTLNFKADGSYACVVDSNAMVAAEAIGNGITIDPAAHISLSDISATILPTGTSFIVINNIAATLISGTFANLPDGATITIGSNIFQANYEGGDGNDLTLTVVS